MLWATHIDLCLRAMIISVNTALIKTDNLNWGLSLSIILYKAVGYKKKDA